MESSESPKANPVKDLTVFAVCTTVICAMMAGPALGASLALLAMGDSVWLLLFTR